MQIAIERIKFQSTRPRGARPHESGSGAWLYKVSIHAPAGGATPLTSARSESVLCFNPRARGGRDAGIWQFALLLLRFNPRARGGRDAAVAAAFHQGSRVSIHAPAGGATHHMPHACAIYQEFQSTRPRGARLKRINRILCAELSFNPRARGGRDVRRGRAAHQATRFNPRARGGRDAS